jgi:hypothetical protein
VKKEVKLHPIVIVDKEGGQEEIEVIVSQSQNIINLRYKNSEMEVIDLI